MVEKESMKAYKNQLLLLAHVDQERDQAWVICQSSRSKEGVQSKGLLRVCTQTIGPFFGDGDTTVLALIIKIY